ncbi:MAG: hypothetical protein J2P38_01465, partial [Candidatus Dormibacteraeota bacterium]|nr:hypothetical protein [Candidatus Dormibacteraeota bacterium]
LERAIVGDPDTCVERLRTLAGLGVRSFELRLISRTESEMEEMVDLISESVLPAFRQTPAR